MKEQATDLLILWTDSDKETAINEVDPEPETAGIGLLVMGWRQRVK